MTIAWLMLIGFFMSAYGYAYGRYSAVRDLERFLDALED